MTQDQRDRYDAAHLLALCASSAWSTLLEAARSIGMGNHIAARLLAYRALVASLGCGTWREVRAEAEAKLRCGWRPR